MRRPAFALVSLSALLTGCAMTPTAAPTPQAGAAIQGFVHGGQQPIKGAHIYLLAANHTGYGGSGIAPGPSNYSLSLLLGGHGSPAILDTSGGPTDGDYYVTTGTDGSFSISSDYICTPGQQVYLYAQGGDSGAGPNSAIGAMAILGNCPTAENFGATITTVNLNEVTTIAAAYAMAGFATDATHVSSSNTALAQIGIANAFANAGNLVSIATGAALATTPAGNGAIPQATINTLADILAACINTTSLTPTNCGTLLTNAVSGTTSPMETATAAIYMAQHPGNNVGNLFGLASSNPPFTGLSSQPNDLTVAINFTGGSLNAPGLIAIDGLGNAWAADALDGNVTKLSPVGAVLSPAGGYTGGGLYEPYHMAIDQSNNLWVSNLDATDTYPLPITEISSSGKFLSGTTGYEGNFYGIGLAIDRSGDAWLAGYDVYELSGSGTLLSTINSTVDAQNNFIHVFNDAFDGSGNLWLTQYYTYNSVLVNNILKISPSGTNLSGPNGYTGGGLDDGLALALDSAGNAWFGNVYNGTLTEYSNSGAILTGTNGITTNLSNISSIVIDGAGNVWVANDGAAGTITNTTHNVVEFSNSGTLLSGANNYTAGGLIYGARSIAVDGSGDLWIANHAGNGVLELIGAAVPVVTPICAGLPATPTTDGSSNLGTRP